MWSVGRWAGTGLADARIEAEIADQLARRPEAADIADRGQERRRADHVDARAGHQPACLPRGQRGLGNEPSTAAISASKNAIWRTQRSSVSRSSIGGSSSRSHFRPLTPNSRSRVGGRSAGGSRSRGFRSCSGSARERAARAATTAGAASTSARRGPRRDRASRPRAVAQAPARPDGRSSRAPGGSSCERVRARFRRPRPHRPLCSASVPS